jgi:ComF family protein
MQGFSPNLVVPVPLHPERQRERGFNQAELLARVVARGLGLPMDEKAIARQKPRPPKLRLSRHERWAVVRGAYAATPGRGIDNCRVLLVDDVFTTGATLDACSRALRSAGAAEVAALTVARVVDAWAGAAP